MKGSGRYFWVGWGCIGMVGRCLVRIVLYEYTSEEMMELWQGGRIVVGEAVVGIGSVIWWENRALWWG